MAQGSNSSQWPGLCVTDTVSVKETRFSQPNLLDAKDLFFGSDKVSGSELDREIFNGLGRAL